MPKKLPEVVAAVDLGSNSFHMIVCSLKDGKLQIQDRIREMVRLASGLDKNDALDSETQARALACLEKFGQRVRNFPPGSVRAVGTNTLRIATNAQEFLSKAEQALNHPIDIISGIEEARMIYLGVAYSLGGNGGTRLVMDIGGGSTEYILGTGYSPREKESLHMGCVTLSNQFFKSGKLSKSAFAQAVLFAEQQLEPFQQVFRRGKWNKAIGASGSLRAIDKVLKAKGWSNNGITLEGLEQLAAHIGQCGHVNELKLPDLNPDRLPIFPGGVAIVYATFKILGIEQMTVSDGALREGLIQDLMGRIFDHDIRSATVRNWAERFHTDKPHAARVKQTIAYMLPQLRNDNTPIDNDTITQFLNWAADLHEIGRDIAHSGYHKHSAYIIENGDLAGFSRQDQTLLATLIRTHRRKFVRSLFAGLPAPWNEVAPYLSIILRLAVLLRRNRFDADLPKFGIAIEKSKIRLSFPENWLNASPLTHADLLLEADYLKQGGFKLDFC
ncbi:exopolyphosphatase [Methylomicrobium sp. Wu6]|uniref:exopolyphosphatase n=1 Tax=Methylomicrobium sp. Wu6 TaxID=3107928 RepID=UPI002DD67480|nr:exopolyphosphatase [Methylomicrobium sp. Wu6]MEC4750287.1 exopolyphosphatase [Methylomicrobium sp. Wu6]